MSRDRSDEPTVPSWDGEVAGWSDYCRRVRLCHSQTLEHKRHTLGPRLVLKLKGKAWDIAAMVDHEKLSTNYGAQYLLHFLREKMGRLPVPDVGQHLEELFVKCRRSPQMEMVQWCNSLREAYRKVQRSMARNFQGTKTIAVQTDPVQDEPEVSSPASTRRRLSGSEPHREPSGEQEQPGAASPSRGDEQSEQYADAEEEQEAPSVAPSWPDDWWYRPRGGNWWNWHSYGASSSTGWGWKDWKEPIDESFGEPQWSELENQLPSILPEEVLGWLLLKRSGLSSAARLSIQAAAGNSLKFADIERAMRQQEDELLQQERQRNGPMHRAQRSFWVEEEGHWGLLNNEPDDVELEDSVHWVENEVVMAVLDPQGELEQHETAWANYHDGAFEWNWHDDEWHAATDHGWVAYSDMKPWLDLDDIGVQDATLAKELQDLYATFDSKVRTFKEARQAVHQKGKNRGYYQGSKGGKGKGKNPYKGKSTQNSERAAGMFMTKGKGSNTSPVNKPGYSGCFICGEKTHDWRNCPKRGVSGHSPGTKGSKMIGMVTSVEDSSDPSMHALPPPVPVNPDLVLAASMQDSPKSLGWAVIDTGATETVGSLQAVEHVMALRHQRFGAEDVGILPNKVKRFRFGNAQEKMAESYVLLPQTIDGQQTSLGVYTSDVPNIPILLGVRTMERLGAVVDVAKPSLVFTKLFPGKEISLIRGQNRHLLLDLCSDWTQCSPALIAETRNPEQKGSSGRTSDERVHLDLHSPPPPHVPQSFNLHVLEDNMSDTSMETCEIPDMGADTMTLGVFPPPALAETGCSIDLRDSDGEIPRDSEARSQEGRSPSDWPADGGGCSLHEIQGGSRHDPLRLEPSGVCRPSRPEDSVNPLRGISPPGGIRQRISDRMQQARVVASLQPMPVEGTLCTNVGSQSHSQVQWTAGARCEGKDSGEDRWQGGEAQRSQDTDLGIGCCGSVDTSPLGGDLQGENQGQSQSSAAASSAAARSVGSAQPSKHRCSDQEGNQERPHSSGGSSGTGRQGMDKPHEGLELLRDGIRADQMVHLEDDSLATYEPSGFFTQRLPLEQKQFLCEALNTAHEQLQDAFSLVEASNCDLLEVCCASDSSLSRTVQEVGGVAFRVGVENNMDLTTEIGAERARQFAATVRPRWMWISTPCGPHSPMQNMNQRDALQLKRLKQKQRKARKIIRNAIALAREQVQRGGHVGWEWPNWNLAWNYPEVKQFFESLDREGIRFKVRLDGCQVGVVTPDTHEPMLKPWRIEVTCSHMARALSLRCNNNHTHAECVGHNRPAFSAMYPKKMCNIMTRVIMDQSRIKVPDNPGEVDHVYAASADVRQHVVTEKELQNMKAAVRRLHVRPGHPSNRALHMMLKARGVRQEILDIALEHHCDECQEIKLPNPHKVVSFHTSNVLWETVQMDVGQFPFGDLMVHVLIMVDEASRFAVAHELFRHSRDVSRNPTTDEIIRALEQSWCQYHGYPNVLRSDPEGCFRGNELDRWAASRGIELAPCVGEDHGQIGVVESLIGKLKTDTRALLRNDPCDPYVGLLSVVGAHNQMDRVGGFAPAQWAYGRLPSMDNRLFEDGNSLPFHSTEGTLGIDLRANLLLRVRAEEQYRKSQAVDKINRALNTKPRPFQVFLPGDLVYYRRYKTPMSQQASHQTLDTAKQGLARWYGPARVLATETRASASPDTRKPGSVVWVIAGGRLKRCSPHQLRHCSEKEKLLAEASEAVTMPWSFNSLMSMVERGQYEKFDALDDEEDHPDQRRLIDLLDKKGTKRSKSLPTKESNKTSKGPRQEPKSHQEPKGQQTPNVQRPDQVAGEGRQVKGKTRSRSRTHRPQDGPPSSAATAPSHGSELERHPPFAAAKARAPDKPQEQREAMTLSQVLDSEKMYLIADDEATTEMVMMSVDLPSSNKDMKNFIRDSETWVSKKLKKGVELQWKSIPQSRIEDFQKAKAKELSNWISQKAVRLVKEQVPANRVMRMRWIYTVKEDNSAKARIVIIGYQDPDLTSLTTTSPTMSRRSRGLFLTACACRKWQALKGDVRGAFLQGLESETERLVYAKPVIELARELGGDQHSLVQILKACYGLADAPAQWHASVSATMSEAGFIQLQSEPCAWKLLDKDEEDNPILIGLVVAHVDDFLFGGQADHPKISEGPRYDISGLQMVTMGSLCL